MKKRIVGVVLLVIGILAIGFGILVMTRQYHAEQQLNTGLKQAVMDFDSILPELQKGFVNTDGTEEPVPIVIVDGFECAAVAEIPAVNTAFLIQKRDIISGTLATGNFHIDHSYEELPALETGMEIDVTDVDGYVYSYIIDSIIQGNEEVDGHLVLHYEGMTTKYTAVCTVK